MTYFQAFGLAVAQGLTEFFPVSSSGHLVLLEHLWRLPAESRLGLAAVLHLGTALALVCYLGREILSLAGGLFAAQAERRGASLRAIGMIALGSLPAAVVGLGFEDWFEQAFRRPGLVGVMLVVTAGFLLATRFARERKGAAGWRDALLIGLAQAVAILPGISRSGATIAMALLVGVRREDAFRFSFLLSVPAVLGAAFKKLLSSELAGLDVGPVVFGVAVAFAVGLGTLVLLRRIVLRGRLHWFSVYCLALGGLVVFLVR